MLREYIKVIKMLMNIVLSVVFTDPTNVKQFGTSGWVKCLSTVYGKGDIPNSKLLFTKVLDIGCGAPCALDHLF